ncbi:CLUMA_CG004890, isoform A [Clunio marinus]|uniref:CLUMA_CG004890, isoform A n=1 Tax=Clunio marinus TaxID=568069 RepID=A0A1J1HT19_9DIPT|nr:CLUMA_CG004890, isoform A [Clunio marinus]
MVKFIKRLVVLLVIIIFTGLVKCSRQKSPLIVEDDGSRRNRPAECHFGKELKELGSTWFPDLGAPFGKMYCIRCECVPVQKKRRIVARVQCRNIKNECAKPTCDEPILLPGKCCKTCPGDTHSPDTVQDTPVTNITEVEEERNMKYFGALLTGRTSLMLKRDEMLNTYSTKNPQNFAATGRFSFHKKNLYYSFYVSEKASRPRAIQFIDNVGNILEEHSLVIRNNEADSSVDIYQNATGKICGVWRRVPRDYRRLLRENKINAVLIWGGKYQSELALAGPISKYPALSTELFSSLLEPAPGTNSDIMAGSGGTAIVSTSSGVTSSIHLTLILNGLFSMDEIEDVPLNIRLESVEKKQIIIEDIQRVKKPNHDINVIEVVSPVSIYDLRMLTRGKLQITVESRKRPDALRIQGNVISRVSCELFQALLSSHNPESKTKSNGMAWLYMNKDGSLVYNIQTHNLNLAENPLITLTNDNGGKKNTELEDLTSSLQMDRAHGIVERLGPRVLEPLYNGDLGINIATKTETSLIRGKFTVRPVADARDAQEPILLNRVGDYAPIHSVGMAWIAVDNECNLHFDINVAGITNQFYPLQAYLVDMPMEVYGAPVNRRLLEEFNNNHLEGFVLSISSNDLAKLESSVNYLEIASKDDDRKLLKSKLKPIKIPNSCYPIYTDNDVGVATASDNAHQQSTETKCFHSNRFYDDGEQWNSLTETCTVCACNNKRVKCDPIKCPPVKCRKDEQLQKKGDCCPVCVGKNSDDSKNNTPQRGCKLGEQFYKAGSSWHPYLPPNGFDTCAVCTCDIYTLQVSCPRTQCPPLNCSKKVAYRPDKKACCKRCPDPKVIKETNKDINTEEMKDQGSKYDTLNSPTVIMSSGGCKSPMGYHSNGQEWHPVIAPHGEQKCIKCKCKDGNINCEKKRCPRSVCHQHKNGNKKQSHDDEQCCQCRTRRHQGGQRRKLKQQQHHEKHQQNSSKS